jgi:hypothetical protein
MSSEAFVSLSSRTSMDLQRRSGTCTLVAILSSIFLTGCIVAPIPMTKRVEAPGEASGRTAPNLSLLHPGQSTRKDVSEKLSVIDTGYTGEDLFFGRWVSSGSGWVWMIAGDNTGEGGYWRNWRVHNLLVTFDDNGTLKDFNDVDDKRVLKTLANLSATQPRINQDALPTEMQIRRRRVPVSMALEPDSVVFDHPYEPKIHLRIAPTQVASLRLLRPHHPDPTRLEMRMDFHNRTALGRKIQFAISPADAVRFTQYLQSMNSSQTIFR